MYSWLSYEEHPHSDYAAIDPPCSCPRCGGDLEAVEDPERASSEAWDCDTCGLSTDSDGECYYPDEYPDKRHEENQ